MATVTIHQGPYRGEYPVEFDGLTIFEWRVIKKVGGYMPLTIEQGFENADPDLFLALTLVALVRAGKVREESVFDVAKRMESTAFDGSVIEFDFGSADETDGDAGDPPPVTTPLASSSGGSSSPPAAAPSETHLDPIGHPV